MRKEDKVVCYINDSIVGIENYIQFLMIYVYKEMNYEEVKNIVKKAFDDVKKKHCSITHICSRGAYGIKMIATKRI